MVFDSWGGVLADGAFQAFSLAYTRRVLRAAQARARRRSASRTSSSPRAAACGWRRSPRTRRRRGRPGLDGQPRRGARQRVGDRRRAAGQPRPERAVRRRPSRSAPRSTQGAGELRPAAIGATARCGGHVFNLGHGISQHTPPESVSVLVDSGARDLTAPARCRLSVLRACAGGFVRAVSERSGLDLSPKSDSCRVRAPMLLRRNIEFRRDHAKSLISLNVRRVLQKAGRRSAERSADQAFSASLGRFPTKLSTGAVESIEKPRQIMRLSGIPSRRLELWRAN